MTNGWLIPRPRPASDHHGGPLVIMTGWTASGKTTLTEHVSQAGLQRVTGSSVLVPMLDGGATTKASRLLSWLSSPPPPPRDGEADRLADLAVLRMVADAGGCVVESAGSLPLLLSPYNRALLIRLEADPPIRAARLRRLLDDRVAADEAVQIVERKDAATVAACARSWGIALAEPIHQRRYDLVIGCPDTQACADPGQCQRAMRALVDAVIPAYRCYLAADQQAGAARLAELEGVVEQFRPWVRRISSALTDPAAPITAHQWFDRLSHDTGNLDVPRKGASC
jgi:hypothetical protein